MIAAINFSGPRERIGISDNPPKGLVKTHHFLQFMSEEKITKLESDLEALSKLGGWIKALVVGGVTIGIWLGLMEFRQQSDTAAIIELQHRSQEFALWKAEQTGNRYTSVDHNKYATEAASVAATQDKRVTRLEDAIGVVKDELLWIKQNLREKDEKKP